VNDDINPAAPRPDDWTAGLMWLPGVNAPVMYVWELDPPEPEPDEPPEPPEPDDGATAV
jgi:hypothetical protein